ncbi:tellurite resistance TerB family protein [Nocardia huaxiensis]|uniref:Tellurite resistance TerB family protein n=1 Tax=Nocardia huaxiensis TaxID=2755382 RepID=A0A7D6VEP6_9NOCA|nr:TerB family tellurite resistance protein [Nocardia huaxiensis]QLY33694.1 tellurite resistance TerB family protein [Nocardia huaxiensis]UFS99384.1 TerB family tellurite resistance protein [Nocardia huaxiensis]
MAFLNRLISNATSISRLLESAPKWREQLLAKRNELRGGTFRDATMGICALVAAADGGIDPQERMRVAQLIGADPVLQHFPTDELRTLFEDNCNRITMDPAFGRAYVMQQIAKATGKSTEARAVVQMGIMIGNADGNFDAQEIAAVKEACQVLHLDPQEFGL